MHFFWPKPLRGKSGFSLWEYILWCEWGVGAVLDLENRRWFNDLDGVPRTTRNVDSETSLRRVERQTFDFVALGIVEHHIHASAHQNVGFVGVLVAVNGKFGAGQQHVEQTLRLGIGGVVKIVVHSQARAFGGLFGYFVQKFVVEKHDGVGICDRKDTKNVETAVWVVLYFCGFNTETMKTIHKITLCTAVLSVVFLLGVVAGRGARDVRGRTMPPDTVVVCRTETVTVTRPVERLRTLVRYDTVWVPAANNIKVLSDSVVRSADSVRVAVPVHRVRYSDDSTFVAVVSGHRARLDSLVWLRRESQTTLRAAPCTSSPRRVVVSVGPQAGVYRTPAGWQPGVGVGISVGVTLRLGRRERR